MSTLPQTNQGDATPRPTNHQCPGPRILRLTFQIKLADHTTTLVDSDYAQDFPIPNHADGIALLSEQVKSIFTVTAYKPFLTEINHYVQDKLKAIKSLQDNGRVDPETPPMFSDFPAPCTASGVVEDPVNLPSPTVGTEGRNPEHVENPPAQ